MTDLTPAQSICIVNNKIQKTINQINDFAKDRFSDEFELAETLPLFYHYIPNSLIDQLEIALHQKADTKTILDTIFKHLFMACALNFNFWEMKDGNYIRYGSPNAEVGSQRMAAILNSTYETVDYFDNFSTAGDCENFFEKYMPEIPLKQERIAIMADIISSNGRTRYQRYMNALHKSISESATISAEDTDLLIQAFPSFTDPHAKRAQLFLSMVAAIHKNELKHNIEIEISPMPDYRNTLGLIVTGVIGLPQQQIDDLVNQNEWDESSMAQLRDVYALATYEIANRTGYNNSLIDFCLWNIGRGSGLNHPLYTNTMF